MSIFSALLGHDDAVGDCVPLEIVTEQRWDGFSEAERRWATALGFGLDTPSLWPIRTADGGIEKIRVSIGENDACAHDPWWLAGVCEKLGAGLYRFSGELADDVLAAGALGWLLAHYRFDRYRSDPAPMPQRHLLLPKSIDMEAIASHAESFGLIRDLVNTPAADMGPADLQAAAENTAQAYGASCQVTIGDALLTHSFPAIHAVGRAATPAHTPRLIDLRWGDRAHRRVTLIGKGVCFDTGGLNIKPGNHMRLMKKDMAGAAHALGLARMIMAAGLKVHLRLLIPAVENAVSADSYRPGDIVATRKGLTVEIDNTDAEGRMILCDALAYACEDEPDLLLDFATLTGANTSAVGPDMAGVYTDDDGLWHALETASRDTGDPLWRMPLWRPYAKKLKSDVADIANRAAGFPYVGGTIAAHFLQHFVAPGTRWAHVDFFAWHLEQAPGRPKGAAVIAIRAAFQAIAQLCSQRP